MLNGLKKGDSFMFNGRKDYELTDKKENVNYKIIEDKINKVDGAMAQEGMPLTNELKQRLYNCIIGKTTTEQERKEIIEKYRGIYG